MRNYSIAIQDPASYKPRILQFWEKYLPGTPTKRYEWMHEGNPEGPAKWYFMHDNQSGDLIAMNSIMPKAIVCSKRKYRAGIVGDIMVSSKYRGMGYGRTLLCAVKSDYIMRGFDFLYVVPNEKSESLLRKVNFYDAGLLKEYMLPVSFMNLKCKYSKYKYIHKILKIADRLLLINYNTSKMRNKEVYYDNIDIPNDKFQILWKKYIQSYDGIIGDHRKEYLVWRYINNPDRNFTILAEISKKNDSLLGYVIYSVFGNRLIIYDILHLFNDARSILSFLFDVADENKCKGIYIASLKGLPVKNNIRNLYRTGNDVRVLTTLKKSINTEYCYLFSGDRNI